MKKKQRKSSHKFKSQLVKFLIDKRWRSSTRWLLSLVVIIAMLLWNWKLLLATTAGVAIMLLIYFLQLGSWQIYWTKWQSFFRGSNRQFSLAVAGGSMSALTTYMAASIWVDADNRWLATGAILEGFTSLSTLVLLLYYFHNHKTNLTQSKFDNLLTDLTDIDPLKRLISVRQLSLLVNHHQKPQVAEYFCLMLSVEQEPIIRHALLESLQRFDNQLLANQNINQPLQMPINFKHPTISQVYYQEQGK